MTILKPVRLLKDMAISKLPPAEIKLQKHASLVFLHQHRLRCALCYYILKIYHTHGFFVRAPTYTQKKNTLLYDILKTAKGANKLCRRTETGSTRTNVPIVLSVIGHLLREDVLTMDQGWIENQRTLNILKKPGPYRNWYKPMFTFAGDKRSLTLDQVFNILVFGMSNPTCKLEHRSVKEEKWSRLSDASYKKICEVIGDNEIGFYLKLIENSLKSIDVINVQNKEVTLRMESSFFTTATVTKMKLGADAQANIESLQRVQRDLLSKATLAGANIEMIRKSYDVNTGDDELSSSEEADKDPVALDAKYLKGGNVRIAGSKTSTKLAYPEAAFTPIVEQLQTKLQAMMIQLKGAAFDTSSFVSHKVLWESLLEVEMNSENYNDIVSTSKKLETVPEVTLPKLEEMNDDQLVSMFGLAEGSQENLAGKIKTFLAGLNNEEAEEANAGDPNFEEMTDDDLESWLASKGDKFADRLRLFYGPKTGADHEQDPFQSEFATPQKSTRTQETRRSASTKKAKEKARRDMDESHKSSGDEDPVAPLKATNKRKSKAVVKKSGPAKPKASEESDSDEDPVAQLIATKKRKTKSGSKKSGPAKPKASEESDRGDHDSDASDNEHLSQKVRRRHSPDRQAKTKK